MPVYFVDDGKGTLSSASSLPGWTAWNDAYTLKSDDLLVAYVDTSMQALEIILRDSRHKPSGVAIISFQPLSDLQKRWEILQPPGFAFKQWPLSGQELVDLATEGQKLPIRERRSWWLNARSLLARKDANQVAQAARHRFVGRRAAVRLLQGAFLAGELIPPAYETALKELSSAESVTLDVKGHVKDLARYHGAFPRNSTRKLSDILKEKGNLLVIDDQVYDAGWKVLFDRVLPGQTWYAVTPEDALHQVESDSDGLALVLLDLQLPDDPEQGLQVLREIKREHPDLPVVIFSAKDEIPLARRCLRAGADDYFVKELGDTDRDPLDYYDKFKELLEGCLPAPQSRELWRDLRNLPAPDQHSYGRRLFEEVQTYLHLAWYFLTTDVHDPRFSGLFGQTQRQKADVYSHCVVELARALETLVDHRYQWSQINTRLEKLKQILGPGQKLRFPEKLKRLQRDGLLTRQQAEEADGVWRLRSRKAAHRGNKVQPQEARDAFARTIRLVRVLLPEETT